MSGRVTLMGCLKFIGALKSLRESLKKFCGELITRSLLKARYWKEHLLLQHVHIYQDPTLNRSSQTKIVSSVK